MLSIFWFFFFLFTTKTHFLNQKLLFVNQECATDDPALKDVYFVNVKFCSYVEVRKEAQSPPDMPPSLNLQRVSILYQ